jgi:DNA mismatch repair ATPase MutS
MVVRERQAAVGELATAALLDWRQELQVRGRLAGDSRPDPEPFLNWAEGERWLQRRRTLVWMARISPILLCTFGIAQLVGLLSVPIWVAFLFANALLWRLVGTSAQATIEHIARQEGAFRHYGDAFAVLAGVAFEAPRLQSLQATLRVDSVSAYDHMRSLERLTRFVIPRSAQVYWIVQSLLLWDVHALAALESWQARVGRRARGWLTALGEVEALTALASLTHDHQSWVFPDLDSAASDLEAQHMGHPLLSPEVRVDNDLAVGPPGTFVLVTGSNMAGKSTLLRALGTNVVLAQMGGPVCARAFRLPPLALWTSMRVVDSLAHGVSTFLAEVLRLKQIVDASRGVADAADTPILCYLLDEILQGTNTSERMIAARRVIRHLLRQRAIGVVSTHDLTLGDPADLTSAAGMVYFRETIGTDTGRPEMTFDYQLRPGLATSTNALRLMELVGLDLEP